MDLITLFLDLTFLLIALTFFPASQLISQTTNQTNSDQDTNTSLPSTPTPLIVISEHNSPCPSPVPNEASARVDPPQREHDIKPLPNLITGNGRLQGRPEHKRKSVSFSLSSLHDIISSPISPNSLTPDNGDGQGGNAGVGHGKFLRRPPTPYVSGPISPSRRNPEMKNAMTDDGEMKQGLEGLTVLAHTFDSQDPMGVKKGWLMS